MANNNIYPDFSNSKYDIGYVRALVLISDIVVSSSSSTTGKESDKIPEIIDDSVETFLKVDGGYAAAIYLPSQTINGGNANG